MKKPTVLPAWILFFAVPLLWLTLTEAASVNPSGAAIRPYYEGKTLQLIVVFGPGGVTDISARLVARYWGKYIPGNPSVIVQNMPGASGVVGANHFVQSRQARRSHGRRHGPGKLLGTDDRPSRGTFRFP